MCIEGDTFWSARLAKELLALSSLGVCSGNWGDAYTKSSWGLRKCSFTTLLPSRAKDHRVYARPSNKAATRVLEQAPVPRLASVGTEKIVDQRAWIYGLDIEAYSTHDTRDLDSLGIPSTEGPLPTPLCRERLATPPFLENS